MNVPFPYVRARANAAPLPSARDTCLDTPLQINVNTLPRRVCAHIVLKHCVTALQTIANEVESKLDYIHIDLPEQGYTILCLFYKIVKVHINFRRIS